MINLKEHTTIADQVTLIFEGPGYYSGHTKRPLSDNLTLTKIAEEYIEENDVKQFCKLNGYKIYPYLVNCCSEVPSHWEIVNPGELFEEEYLD